MAAPDYAGPLSDIKHRNTRRMKDHDYRGSCIYMFTIKKSPDAPVFSHVKGNPFVHGPVRFRPGCEPPESQMPPYVEKTEIGMILDAEIRKLEEYRPEYIEIYKYVVMPDHCHILLRVKQRLKCSVVKYVSATESAATSDCRRRGIIPRDASLFDLEGINDRIVYGNGQLKILREYIYDNPRRLLIKRLYPDLFRRTLGLQVGDYSLDCVGNIFLLRKPMLEVHVRRRWNEAECAEYVEKCVASARSGMVLVSPAINRVEKEIMNKAIEEGGSVVRLSDRGFGERWKPAGKDFDLCAEGRLLVLVESGAATGKQTMTYDKATRLNRIAEYLAASEAGSHRVTTGLKAAGRG